MVALNTTFDANTVQPFDGFANRPTWIGAVPCQIVKTTKKETASGDGQAFVEFDVVAMVGKYKGQQNAFNLNLWNRNADATRIAQQQLSSLCHIANKVQLTDTDQLIGTMVIIDWQAQEGEYTDQKTGQSRKRTGSQPVNFRFPDGRTVAEARAGKAAAMPYNPATDVADPNVSTGQQSLAGQQASPQATQQHGFAPQAPQSGASAGGFAPAPAGAQQMPAAGAFGNAPSGGNPAPTPPAGGFGAPGAFAPPGQGFAAPAGAPAAGPAGPGPWGV